MSRTRTIPASNRESGAKAVFLQFRGGTGRPRSASISIEHQVAPIEDGNREQVDQSQIDREHGDEAHQAGDAERGHLARELRDAQRAAQFIGAAGCRSASGRVPASVCTVTSQVCCTPATTALAGSSCLYSARRPHAKDTHAGGPARPLGATHHGRRPFSWRTIAQECRSAASGPGAPAMMRCRSSKVTTFCAIDRLDPVARLEPGLGGRALRHHVADHGDADWAGPRCRTGGEQRTAASRKLATGPAATTIAPAARRSCRGKCRPSNHAARTSPRRRPRAAPGRAASRSRRAGSTRASKPSRPVGPLSERAAEAD